MITKLIRVPFVMFIACLFITLVLVLPNSEAQAGPMKQDSDTQPCKSCHADVQEAWQMGAHSSARTNHVLEESMNCLSCHPALDSTQNTQQPPADSAADKDGVMKDSNCVACHTTGYNPETGLSASYGVTCEACHTPVADHPNKDIATNTDTELCGRCHSDSRFNWDNWKNSRHYRANMRCVECHDPHSTSLHNTGTEPTADKSALCLSCHEADEHLSPYSVHGRAGITCVDCHLGEKSGVDTFHVVPNHSFKPEMETCSNCHAEEIHRPAKPSADLPAVTTPIPDSTPSVSPPAQEQEIANTQSPESKQPENQWWWLALLGIASLIGLVVGSAIPMVKAMFKGKSR